MEQQKKIHVIVPTANVSEDVQNKYRQKRVAAYCRVSTQQEEQLNSYEAHIAINMDRDEKEDRSIEIKVRIAEIDAEFKKLLSTLSVNLDNNAYTENAIAELMSEKRALEKELEKYKDSGKTSEPESKLKEISHITEIIGNQPLQFDDELIRQMLECVVVQSKEQITIVFKDGTEVNQSLN